jgi:hypothetical protein
MIQSRSVFLGAADPSVYVLAGDVPRSPLAIGA